MSRGSNVCNGPLITGMYNVKPYYDNNTPLQLPQCMYTLNSIYSSESNVRSHAEVKFFSHFHAVQNFSTSTV